MQGKEPGRTSVRLPILTGFLVLAWSPAFAQTEVEFGFDGFPCRVVAESGSETTLEGFVAIRTPDVEPTPSGWSMSLTADGGEIVDVTSGGLLVPTNLGRLERPDVLVAEVAHHPADPDRSGVVLASILRVTQARTLAPSSTALVAKIEVRATVPADGSCGSVTLRFEDGFRGSGEPVNNVAVIENKDSVPRFEARTIELCPSGVGPPCEVPLIEAGTPAFIGMTRTFPGRSFAFRGERGKNAVITFLDPAPTHRNAIYARWNEEATSTRFDRAVGAGGPAPRLIVPLDREGTLFLRVEGRFVNPFHFGTLLVEESELLLDSISRDQASTAEERVELDVAGAGFDPATSFSLELPGTGESFETEEAVLVSSELARLRFDLRGARQGDYDLVARREPFTARLGKALSIVEARTGPLLEVELSGGLTYRCNRVKRLTLGYRNVGDAPMEAPLFRVTLPEGSEVWLEGTLDEGEGLPPSPRDVLLLGVSPSGAAGTLAPGASGELALLFRERTCIDPEAAPDEVGVRVSVFSPSSGDEIPWETLEPPGGLAADDWEAIRVASREEIGDRWDGYGSALARVATRLALRGRRVASVADLFRFLAREVSGHPSAAAVGTLRAAESGTPISGVDVLALDGGAVLSRARTDDAGRFTLACLENAATYHIQTAGAGVTPSRMTIPPAGDLLGLTLHADGEPDAPPDGPPPGSPGCDVEPLPDSPLVPPSDLFDPASLLDLIVIGSWDPNEKDGDPFEEGNSTRIRAGETIEYTIFFENRSEATSAAQRVVITDVIDPALMLDTLEHLTVQVGGDDPAGKLISVDQEASGSGPVFDARLMREDLSVTYPFGQQSITAELDVLVDISVGAAPFAGSERTVTWVLSTTGVDPDDPAGFLPPNDSTKRGEGFVSFRIKARDDLPDGIVITNEAEIRFDDLLPISTEPVLHRIDSFLLPSTPYLPVPPGMKPVDRDVELRWSSERAESYDLFLWAEGEPKPPVPLAEELEFRAFRPATLEPGTRYFWQVVAKNLDGVATGPEWSFRTLGPPFRRGDVNGDRDFNITDVIRILDFLFVGASPPPDCQKSADVNDDGALNITDPILVLNHLFLGAAPPREPFAECGRDPTEDELPCRAFAACD